MNAASAGPVVLLGAAMVAFSLVSAMMVLRSRDVMVVVVCRAL